MRVEFTTETRHNFFTEIDICGVGYEEVFGSSARVLEEGGLPVWETSWSQFKYTQVENGFYVYEGAENGFLTQELIPCFGGVKIISVEGSYGTFNGPDALVRYKERKSKAYAQVEKISGYLNNFSEGVDGYMVAEIAACLFGNRKPGAKIAHLVEKAKEKLA